MDKISDIHYGKLPEDAPYVKPFRFYFTQNGKVKNWDLLKVSKNFVCLLCRGRIRWIGDRRGWLVIKVMTK
jgi:hypothetical protein